MPDMDDAARQSDTHDNPTYLFGPFQLLKRQRRLLRDGKAVALRGREFDLLLHLIENSHRFVGNDELIAAVFPNLQGGEQSLRVQIGRIRRALSDADKGPSPIVNEPGRGYRFQPPLTVIAPPAAHTTARSRLPRPLKSIFGRTEAASELSALVRRHRLVTIAGAGGIGKTTLALMTAEALRTSDFSDMAFVDLAHLHEPRSLPATVATHLVDGPLAADAMETIVSRSGTGPRLLILDNCEHMVDAVAAFCEALQSRAAALHILTTSREPLRAQGERLYRLGPLELPDRRKPVSVTDIRASACIQLFIERTQLGDSFDFSDTDLHRIADTCRQLDGTPLAIELAAAQVATFGVSGVADRVSESFSLLTSGRRSTVPRHRTLTATLDWSFATLTPAERQLLLRLSVFCSGFSIDAALRVAGDEDMTQAQMETLIGDLAAKSLVSIDSKGPDLLYRLLFLTRSYASEKRSEDARAHETGLRHAGYCLDILYHADFCNAAAQPHSLNGQLDEARSAIDWTFSVGEDLLGIQLTTRAIELTQILLMIDESLKRLETALSRRHALPEPRPDLEMKLALQHINLTMNGVDADALERSWTHILSRLDEVSAPDCERLVDAIAYSAAHSFGAGDYPEHKLKARQIVAFASRLPSDSPHVIVADRIMAQSLHFQGQYADSMTLIRKSMTSPIIATVHERTRHVDPRVSLRIFAARNLWLQGFAEQAEEVARHALEAAQDQPHTVCYVLSYAALPLAIWRGKRDWAEKLNWQQKAVAEAHDLKLWRDWAITYDQVLQSEVWTAATPQVEAVFSAHGPCPIRADFLAGFHTAFCGVEALRRAEEKRVVWTLPEILRAKGERASDPNEARHLLQAALHTARAQGAVAFELRAGTSLSRHLHLTGRGTEAMVLLEDITCRLPECIQDRDMVEAHRILNLIVTGKTT